MLRLPGIFIVGANPGLTHEIGLKKVEHRVVVPGRLLAFAAQTRFGGSVLTDQVDSNLPQ